MNMGHTVLYDGIKVPEILICMLRSVGDESIYVGVATFVGFDFIQ